ncbi:MAG: DUF456 domain-containing protein [Bacteroidales bacterium]|jgi:uncharacterized protein YqgC (DUF456 family)|nr:DUF456 domain-containing protein [Bacteroidales bacterium]
METFYIVLGVLLLLAGIAGAILPVLPGPILAYLSLISLYMADKGDFTDNFLITWGLVAVGVTALDYVVPVLGAKKFGGSKYGTRGCMLGLLAGLFLGPFGIIIGPFAGAVIGEMLGGKEFNTALKAGIGSFIGFLAGTFLKLVFAFVIVWFFINALL